MVSRIPPRNIVPRQLRIILWTGFLALVFALAIPAFDGTTALAATPYNYTDGSEGDPGDGVLNPRSKEGKEELLTPQDGLILPGDDGRVSDRAVIFWSHPYLITPNFRYFGWFDARFGLVTGPRTFLLAGRGWNHAR